MPGSPPLHPEGGPAVLAGLSQGLHSIFIQHPAPGQRRDTCPSLVAASVSDPLSPGSGLSPTSRDSLLGLESIVTLGSLGPGRTLRREHVHFRTPGGGAAGRSWELELRRVLQFQNQGGSADLHRPDVGQTAGESRGIRTKGSAARGLRGEQRNHVSRSLSLGSLSSCQCSGLPLPLSSPLLFLLLPAPHPLSVLPHLRLEQPICQRSDLEPSQSFPGCSRDPPTRKPSQCGNLMGTGQGHTHLSRVVFLNRGL